MKDLYNVIDGLLQTERSTLLRDKENKYSLRVNVHATKNEIKEAVEKLFKVKVTKVNTMVMAGKKRRMGLTEGRKENWKKAIVTLKTGDTIKFFEGA